MNFPLILNLLVFLALLFGLSLTRHTAWSLAKKVLLALVIGVLFGLGLHLVYGADSPTLKTSIGWFDLVGSGYVQLLQMIVIPLVFASILSAVARLHNASSLGKISFLTIGTLLFTTMIAALVGIGLTNLFGLTADGLVAGAAEMSRLQVIQSDYAGKVSDLNVPQLLLSFIPQNPFADLARAKPTSIISVVIFAAFLGIAALQLFKDEPEKGGKILSAIDTLQAWVMRLVRLVMKLTPYGVLALMTKVVATSNLQDIIKLGSFVVVSYIGLALMFVIHGVIVSVSGVNPLRFFRKGLAGTDICLHQPFERGQHPAEHRSANPSPGDSVLDRQLCRLVWRHHRSKRLRRSVPGHAGGDGCTDSGHQPAGPGVDRVAGSDCDFEFGWRGRRGRRCNLRRPDRASGHGLAGVAGGVADFGRAVDRHGPYGTQRQRFDGSRYGDQPDPAPDRQGHSG